MQPAPFVASQHADNACACVPSAHNTCACVSAYMMGCCKSRACFWQVANLYQCVEESATIINDSYTFFTNELVSMNNSYNTMLI